MPKKKRGKVILDGSGNWIVIKGVFIVNSQVYLPPPFHEAVYHPEPMTCTALHNVTCAPQMQSMFGNDPMTTATTRGDLCALGAV